MIVNRPLKQQQESFTLDNKVPLIKQQSVNHQSNILNKNFTKIQQPTESELCQAVVLIKKVMPNRSLQRAITLMHEILNQNVYEQKNIHNKSHETFPKTLYMNHQNVTSQVIKNYLKDDLLKTSFCNSHSQTKYKQKRLIAKSFVARGYGYQFALQQFKKAKQNSNLQKDSYKRLVGSIVTQAFRKLQAFLVQDCAKNIFPLSKQQLSKIITHLLSSTYYGDSVLVFKKFLRFLYGLSNVTLCELQTLKFYESILLQVRSSQLINDTPSNQTQPFSFPLGQQVHLGNFPLQNSPILCKQNTSESVPWSIQQDRTLVNIYLVEKSTTKTFLILSKDNPILFTLDRIRNRLSQLYYKALQNLKMAHFEQFSFPTISQSHIKFLSKSKSALQVRIQLLIYLFSESYSPNSYQLLKSVLQLISRQQDLIYSNEQKHCANFNKQSSQFYDLHNFQLYQDQQNGGTTENVFNQ